VLLHFSDYVLVHVFMRLHTTYSEEAAELQRQVRAVDVALGNLGDDRVQRVAELAPALELLIKRVHSVQPSSTNPEISASLCVHGCT
jgi:hypothetical protein